MLRIRANVAYNGTAYFGWSKNSRDYPHKTVQGALENAVAKYFGLSVQSSTSPPYLGEQNTTAKTANAVPQPRSLGPFVTELPVVSKKKVKRGPIYAPIPIQGGSRTDTGVHALSQIIHLDADREQVEFREKISGMTEGAKLRKFIQGVNFYLRDNKDSIGVVDAEVANSSFHARFSALRRVYHYRISLYDDLGTKNGIEAVEGRSSIGGTSWLIDKTGIDLHALQQAAKSFEGTHNFLHFSRRTNDGIESLEEEEDEIFGDASIKGKEEKTNGIRVVRTVDRVEVCVGKEIWENWNSPFIHSTIDVQVEAKSFMRGQVRKMIGSMVDVGRGRMTVGDLQKMLQGPVGTSSENLGIFDGVNRITFAPPEGLYLARVIYE